MYLEGQLGKKGAMKFLQKATFYSFVLVFKCICDIIFCSLAVLNNHGAAGFCNLTDQVQLISIQGNVKSATLPH